MKDIFSHIYSEEVQIIILKYIKIISTSDISYLEIYRENTDNIESYYFNELKLGEKKYFYSKNNFLVNNVVDYKKGGYVLHKNEMSPIKNLTPEGIEKLAYNYFKQFQFIEISFNLN